MGWPFALAFVLMACAGPGSPTVPVDGSALFGDAEFDQAPLAAPRETTMIVGEELPAVVGIRVEVDALGSERSSQVSPQAVLPAAEGTVALIRHDPEGDRRAWAIDLIDQASGSTTLVYAGRREIDSVAVSADGQTVLLAMRRALGGNADFEVFRLNAATGAVVRLTDTGFDERNVSLSADGSVMAWEGSVPGDLRAVFMCEGDVATGLSLSLEQREPSLSGNGRYLGLVRVLADGSLRVVRYDRVANTYLAAWEQEPPVNLSHPSTSDDGLRIAFLEHRPAAPGITERQRVHILDLDDGSVDHVVEATPTDGPRIRHPHLTRDGDHLAYGWRQGEAWNVLTQRVSTGETQQITSSRAPAAVLAPYWQQPAASGAVGVVGVVIEPAEPVVRVGETTQLTATVTVVGDASQAVVWGTLDDDLVDVDGTGGVTGLQAGSATVTATSVADPTKSASVVVAVQEPSSIVSVTIEPEAPVVEAGGSLALTGIVTMVGLVSAELWWVSSDESIVEVTSTGLLLGLRPGVAQVTATSVVDPTKSATVDVTVVEPETGVAVVVVPAFSSLPLGGVETLTAQVFGADVTDVTWSTTCGDVDPSTDANQVAYTSPLEFGTGFCYVFATSVADPSVVGVAEVTLTDEGPVLSVTIYPQEPVVAVGASLALQADVVINEDVAEAVVWEVADPSIATIDLYGLLTGAAVGTTTVTATSVVDASKSDTVIVTVEPARVLDWIRQFGTGSYDAAVGVATDADGNVYVAGNTYGDLGGPQAGAIDVFLHAYDRNGGFRWAEQFGTAGTDVARGIASDANGNVYVTGYTLGGLAGPSEGGNDAFLRAYDRNGNLRWTHQFGTSSEDLAYAVATDTDGSVYAAGTTFGTLDTFHYGSGDAFLRAWGPAGVHP